MTPPTTTNNEAESRMLAACRQKCEELERINDELRRFVHLTANELLEPLRAVRGYTELLEARLPQNIDPEVLGFTHRIAASGDRLSKVLRDLLDYAMLSSAALLTEQVNMADVFSQAKAELQTLIRRSRANITRQELPYVAGDPAALRTLLKCLLTNALTFRRSDPEIELGYRINGSRHLFWVRDDGIGIDEEYLEEVFQPFRRLHTLDEYGGTGLGLTVARSVVERHAGNIWIQSVLGAGTTVFFELPGGA